MYCIVNFNTRGAVGQLITQEMTTGDSMLGKVVVARSGKRESRERDWACAITTPTDRLDWNSPTEWRWNAERHSTRGTQFSLSLLFDSPFLRSIIRRVSHSPSFLVDVRISTRKQTRRQVQIKIRSSGRVLITCACAHRWAGIPGVELN